MIPLFPSINPNLIGSLMNNGSNTGAGVNEEQEITALEQEQQNYLNLVENLAQDLTPMGKMQSESGQNEDSDDSAAASDDQESSASEADESDDQDHELEL